MMTALLEARSLTFGYRRAAALFDSWDARFESGELVAVTGPSGRGKSTLLYLLGLMVQPQGGQVLIDGVNVSGQSDACRAQLRAAQLGFVFQDAALDASRTVLDNVVETSLYRRQSRSDALRRAQELLAEFGVEQRADHRPGQISGGQAQRIALCRALLSRPRILLADEPTGNLDADSAAVVLGAFRERADHGATVVVATHDAALVSACDRTISLEAS